MQVLCVGYCTLDQIGLVEHFARDDEEVEMPTFSIQGGGTAATASVALAKWGASPSFVGKVADDERGELIVRTLSDEGVNTDHVVRQKGRISQVRFVVVEASTGERHCYYTPGNVEALVDGDIDAELVDDQDLLVVDGACPEAQRNVMIRARKQGIPIVCEVNRNRKIASDCIAHADVVVASEREASSFTGVGSLEGICEAILEKGPQTAIITLGDEGAVALGRQEEFVRVDARPIDLVDTTGSADIFLGAVSLGVLEGWSLEKMVRFANAAAGICCTAPGGRSAIADRNMIEAELE